MVDGRSAASHHAVEGGERQLTDAKPTPVMRSSVQTWKLWVFCISVLLGGALMCRNIPTMDSRPDDFSPFFGTGAIGALLVIGGFTFACLSIRCPGCRTRWVWNSMSSRDDGLNWFAQVATRDACRQCGWPSSPDRDDGAFHTAGISEDQSASHNQCVSGGPQRLRAVLWPIGFYLLVFFVFVLVSRIWPNTIPEWLFWVAGGPVLFLLGELVAYVVGYVLGKTPPFSWVFSWLRCEDGEGAPLLRFAALAFGFLAVFLIALTFFPE